jgi:hypothetical protein
MDILKLKIHYKIVLNARVIKYGSDKVFYKRNTLINTFK